MTRTTRPTSAFCSASYLPGTVPTGFRELNRFLFYDRDTGIPMHRVRWNWIYDLPFGRNRKFGRGPNAWLNAAIGGWPITGAGTVLSTWFSMPTNQWGEMGNFAVYRNKHKILDCRQAPATSRDFKDERCVEGYLWFNGCSGQRFLDSRNAYGLRNGVFGLPENYKPAQQPLIPWPANRRAHRSQQRRLRHQRRLPPAPHRRRRSRQLRHRPPPLAQPVPPRPLQLDHGLRADEALRHQRTGSHPR
jgi:hypothetical protein